MTASPRSVADEADALRQRAEAVAHDVETATLHLAEPITVPKDGIPFTLTLSGRLDGSFDVIGGPTI